MRVDSLLARCGVLFFLNLVKHKNRISRVALATGYSVRGVHPTAASAQRLMVFRQGVARVARNWNLLGRKELRREKPVFGLFLASS